MDILILSTEAIGIGGRQHLNIRHCGNEYVVSLFAEGFRAKSCHRHFSSIDDALLKYNEMYRVDVTTNPDLNTREAYLYHKMGCIKMLILEMHIDEYTLEEFMGFVEADIESDEYIKKYEEKYRRH